MAAKVIPLSLIGQELNNTIEHVQANLESYASNRGMHDMLNACIEQVDQLRGIFNLTLFVSAEVLAKELLELFQDIAANEEADQSSHFTVAVKSLEILRRYLDVLNNKDNDIPELLLPIINEIRVGRKKTALSESYFYATVVDTLPTTLANQQPEQEVAPATIRRLRHMYQVGLTNVIREENVAGSARMMLRSVENIQKYSGNLPFAYLWWAVRAVLQGMSQELLSVSRPRKMLLGQMDRQFKAAEQDWKAALQQPVPDALLKDMLYLVALIPRDIGNVFAVKEAFGLSDMPSDASLARQQKALLVLSNVAQVISEKIKTEIAIVKELLEIATESPEGYNFNDIIARLETIKVALIRAEINTPAKVLSEQIDLILKWQSSGVTPARDDLMNVANAVLYIESAINTLGSSLMEEAEGMESDSFEAQKTKIIANSQLVDAQRILLVEAQNGLVEAIRQTMAYVESDYDKNALAEVNDHLRAASGGLMFMKLDRGARIVGGCIAFFEKEIFEADEKPNQQKLDAIADALTAMEYYLGGLMENKHYGEGMLDVAEEGLQALGYLK